MANEGNNSRGTEKRNREEGQRRGHRERETEKVGQRKKGTRERETRDQRPETRRPEDQKTRDQRPETRD